MRATSRSKKPRPTSASTGTCARRTSCATRTTAARRSSGAGRAISTLIVTPPGLRSTTSRKSCEAEPIIDRADQAKRRLTMAIERNAKATWMGDLKSGSGEFDLEPSGSINGGEGTLSSPFEQPGGKTSPEELIAAAPATCFSMALANGLAQDGHAPTKLETEAEVTLDNTGDGFAITSIQLTVRGQVDGLDESAFKQAAEQAKKNCPVSKALAAVPKIELDAALG